jgi:hypothetical protein
VRYERTASTRLFLAVAASAVFVSVLTATMINVLIPLIRAQFGASTAEVGWVVTGYSLAYAVGVPLYGRISDFFGVRAVFSIGLAGFAVGGLVCALAPSLTMLVFGRIVQGVGGAAVPALAIVSVAKVLPAGERGAGIGLIGASLGAAAAVGPVLGGFRYRGRQRGEPSEATRVVPHRLSEEVVCLTGERYRLCRSSCSTPGEVSDNTCVSIPAASMASILPSSRSHSCSMSFA